MASASDGVHLYGGGHTLSLERLLEVAHATGELVLTCRNLKTFPKHRCKFDLKDTVSVGKTKRNSKQYSSRRNRNLCFQTVIENPQSRMGKTRKSWKIKALQVHKQKLITVTCPLEFLKFRSLEVKIRKLGITVVFCELDILGYFLMVLMRRFQCSLGQL